MVLGDVGDENRLGSIFFCDIVNTASGTQELTGHLGIDIITNTDAITAAEAGKICSTILRELEATEPL